MPALPCAHSRDEAVELRISRPDVVSRHNPIIKLQKQQNRIAVPEG
jgi:hypothetical protein